MLYSVAGGDFGRWAEPQMKRFALGLTVMFVVAMVPIWFWRNMAALAYGVSVLLLLAVEFFGVVGMGAQRWIDLGFMRLQPSELTKITLVMMLAAYYDWLDVKKVSRPFWVLIPVLLILLPTALVLMQPDLGTAHPAAGGRRHGDVRGRGELVVFLVVGAAGVGLVSTVFASRGTAWQLLQRLPVPPDRHLPRPRAGPAGRGLPHHPVQDRAGFGRLGRGAASCRARSRG